MDKRNAVKLAEEYIKLISLSYNVKQAIIFGSFAKGTNHPESDIDIAIVIKNLGDVIQAQSELMKLRRKIDLRIEPHPFREIDFTTGNPLVNEIMKHGIRLKKIA